MYKIAVCEDDTIYLELIAEWIRRYFSENYMNVEVHGFSDADYLMEQIEKKILFDAYILDIKMPVYTGMDLAREIRSRSRLPFIIFLTSHEEYSIDACGLQVSGYVMKARAEKRLGPVLKRLFQDMEEMKAQKTYKIENQRRCFLLMQKDILYIDKKGKNVVFHMKTGDTEEERLTLQQAYEKMDNPDMIFLNRKTIINLAHITRIESQTVTIDGIHTFPVRDTSLIKGRLTVYWGKEI